MTTRAHSDSLGEIQVPSDALWGAQTQRSIENFQIGNEKMPIEIVRGFGFVKKAAAITNHELGVLDETKKDLIVQVCDEILAGKLDDQFPLVPWQTGSGTQTNMNVNEVIAHRGHVLNGGNLTDAKMVLHPNDDVNRSQSSNDTFPTAMHIASYVKIVQHLMPNVQKLRDVLQSKSKTFTEIQKIGRTHLMDATPLSLGQEFSGYVSQLDHALISIKNALPHLAELPLGATAVGTGINAPEGYQEKVVQQLAELTTLPFVVAENNFEALSAHDAMVEMHAALKVLAVSLMHIGRNIRMLGSGPRCGIGELSLPANEPGSSIMPGKVNPTQAEALTMVCAQVIGNDMAVSCGGMLGDFQLNVFKPLLAKNVLQSSQLLGDACLSFATKCVDGLDANLKQIQDHRDNSLMLVTSLTPHIGYDKAAEIAKKAHAEGTRLKEAALALGYVSETEFEQWLS